MSKKEEKEVKVADSPARLAFKGLMENYRKQNPVKYERKLPELEKKLAAIE
jgi:hypothetical protein